MMREDNAVAATAALRTLFPPGIALAGGGLDPVGAMLFPEESRFVERASPKRRRDFLAGRFYARQALAMLNCPASPLPMDGQRAPVWPGGYTGSISHCPAICMATAAPAGRYRAIGIDVEDDRPLPADTIDLVCNPGELNARSRLEAAHGIDLPKLLFSIKEACFKSTYMRHKTAFDFRDFHIAISLESPEFSVRCEPLERLSANIRPKDAGRFFVDFGLVASWSFVTAP